MTEKSPLVLKNIIYSHSPAILILFSGPIHRWSCPKLAKTQSTSTISGYCNANDKKILSSCNTRKRSSSLY